MSALEAIAVVAAGLAAGTINTVVGSGTLVTFPVLLAIGLPPVIANVSNTVGLVPGSISGAVGYRAELAGQRGRAIRLGAMSVIGGLAGAVILLVLPDESFRKIVPPFIAAAIVLVLLQPRLARRLAARLAAHPPPPGTPERESLLARAGVLATGVYGGYFGAAQGIMLMGVLGATIDDDLQRLNAVKNVLAGLANGVSGLVFALVANVDWTVVLLVALGATAGGQLGARIGRRLPPAVLRGVIVVVGITAIVQLVT